MPMANATANAQKVASVVAKMKSTRASLLQRGLRQDAVEQGRQRHVDDEEIHPGQRGIGNLLELAAGKADENQPEKRQREIEDVDHPQGPGRPLRDLFTARHRPLGAAFAFL